MGMMEESVEELWGQAKAWVWSIAKVVAVSFPVYGALRWAGIEPDSARLNVVMALVFWGSVMFFVGPRMTGAGFWAGFRGSYTWVDSPTPARLWRFGGVVSWGIALACLVLMD